MNKTRRYEYWFYMLVLTVFISCRKDLYYEHCKEVDLHLEITYSWIGTCHVMKTGMRNGLPSGR